MKTLVTKLALAAVAMGRFAADKENTDQRYSYISADQVLSRAGRALAEQGIVVLPEITHEATEQINYESYGKKKSRYDTVVEMDMQVTDGESSINRHWVGRGVDYASPDKAYYKAVTSGHKYFLMKVLNIGIGNEDNEHDDGEAAVRPTEAPSTPQSTPPPPTATNGRNSARGRLHKEISQTFPPDGDGSHDQARHWAVEVYTKNKTPDDIRKSSKQLTDVECGALADALKRNRSWWRDKYLGKDAA